MSIGYHGHTIQRREIFLFCVNNLETTSELKSAIQNVIGEMESHLCEIVMKHFKKSVMPCR